MAVNVFLTVLHFASTHVHQPTKFLVLESLTQLIKPDYLVLKSVFRLSRMVQSITLLIKGVPVFTQV